MAGLDLICRWSANAPLRSETLRQIVCLKIRRAYSSPAPKPKALLRNDRIRDLVALATTDYAFAMTEDFSITAIEVTAAQGGDEAAMDRLFSRYLPRVARIVAARMGQKWQDLGLGDDIVQETFLDAFTAIRAGNIRDESAFTSWLAQCVQRNLVDRLRHDTREKRGGTRVQRFADMNESMLTESMFGGTTDTASQIASRQESEAHLESILSTLDPRYREVIALRAYCHMPYKQIAESMGLPSENTANALFLRARKELQNRLDG